ncbi:hypothetical protein SAMN06297422_101142 [Lachnospiraceae bacterium]|nr:hypothetical protein SAMN06297422_101142 [Lachnospiraceae bacterium]
MYRETSFESTVKWFVVGAAGISAFCQLILLFTEFTFFGSVGMLFNGLYHFVGVLAFGVIILLILKQAENKEIYSSYVIGLFSLLGAMTDICLLVKYILCTNGTEGFKIWLIVLIALLTVLEIFYAVIIVKFGLDKVTSVFPILLTTVVVIFRGCVYSSVDSNLQTYAYNEVNKSIFSIWTFMFLLFFLATIVCLMLYLDSGFLSEVIQNPENLFSKNTLFGTYTNLYLKEEPKGNIKDTNLNENIQNNNTSPINEVNTDKSTMDSLVENTNASSEPVVMTNSNTEINSKSSNDSSYNSTNNNPGKGKKTKLIVGIVVAVLICGAVGGGVFAILSNKSGLFNDKNKSVDPVAQKMIEDIDSIGDVSLDDEELIMKLTERYSSLTDEQKGQVTNYATLLTASDELEKLVQEDNKPIELTVDNAEEYLKIDVHTDNLEETTRPGLTKKGDYYYYFDVTCDVSPMKSYYFEDVKLSVKWNLSFGELTATYDIDLNDAGEGSYSYNQKYEAGLMRMNKYREYFKVKSYTITEISGKVYKKKPE